MNKDRYKCSYEGCEAAYNKESRLKVHILKHTGEVSLTNQKLPLFLILFVLEALFVRGNWL